MTDVDRTPTPASSGLSVGSAGVVVLLAWSASPFAGAIGVLGWVVCILGLLGRSTTTASVGASGLWLSAIVASLAGLPVAGVLLATALAVLAWDAGRRAIDLGEALAGDASTWRVEALHGSTTALVGVGGVVVSLGLYRSVPGGAGVASAASLFLAVLVGLWALQSG